MSGDAVSCGPLLVESSCISDRDGATVDTASGGQEAVVSSPKKMIDGLGVLPSPVSQEVKDDAIKMSLLSDKAIIEHMKRGTIVIKPFRMHHLSTSSYDVTLGPYFYRETTPEPGMGIYNPYSREHVHRVWGTVHEAESARDWMQRHNVVLENISPTDSIIWIRPGETILGHTNEFLGGRVTVTTMMKARSSMGRNFIEVCKCAGWGDIGYINRWTMEITNNSRHYAIPLVVGRRIAQIVFFDSDGTLEDRDYADSGKYQSSRNLDEVMASWRPSDMLPKMYMDKSHSS